MADFIMKVEASNTFSVTALDRALPPYSPPGNEKGGSGCSEAVYDPSHPPPDLISPCYYGYVPKTSFLTPPGCIFKVPALPTPPPPGIIDGGDMTFRTSYEEQAQDGMLVETRLFGRIGLHCYNLEKGTNFQFLGLDKEITTALFYRTVILGAEDPIRNIKAKFSTYVCYGKENEGCFTVHTLSARKISPPPADGPSQNTHHGVSSLWMPNWLPKNAVNKLHYYEMNESEVQENKDWLLVYAELALYSWLGYGYQLMYALPLEVVKVFVQTTEDVEPKNKAKAKNAIFYIIFKTGSGLEFKGIIKRATDGRPDRFSLEAKCPVL
uniref:UPF0725 protein n=1 Tax=Noccaea caerulescens TaxID=107243 RepID=A0A1J3I7K5_NOCCA